MILKEDDLNTMDDISWISYKIFDLIPDKKYFYDFNNTYRLHTKDDINRQGNILLSRIPPNNINAPTFPIVTPRWDFIGNDLWPIKKYLTGPTLPQYINHSWEPIEPQLDNGLFDFKNLPYGRQKNYFIIHSERDSEQVKKIEALGFKTVYWFAHGYLCANYWYKNYNNNHSKYTYNNMKMVVKPIASRWVCMNRLVDNKRVHRIKLLNLLDLSKGIYSLPKKDPQTNRNINTIYRGNKVKHNSFDDHDNSSAWIVTQKLDPINTSFLHVVTETVFQDQRKHLTEKVFKPIILHQPFVLVGAQGTLDYLKSYGFKTFSKWWSEDYDNIKDNDERLKSIADIVNYIGSKTLTELEDMRLEMMEILDHNFKRFYNGFSDQCWSELKQELGSLYE